MHCPPRANFAADFENGDSGVPTTEACNATSLGRFAVASCRDADLAPARPRHCVCLGAAVMKRPNPKLTSLMLGMLGVGYAACLAEPEPSVGEALQAVATIVTFDNPPPPGAGDSTIGT